MEDIRTQIGLLDLDKSCGTDGIHVRFLHVLRDSSLVEGLQHLFRRCWRSGRTPRAWNESDIHLIPKDIDKPPDATNLRPITLICSFRKLFERLLLTKFDLRGWARLHDCQAGFRADYATYTNAAVVHHLLSSKVCDTAIFLDIKSAFDRVDHRILRRKLHDRSCPPAILLLIEALMFRNVRSRLLVNGQASAYFPRTRGVLQGSPLSPYLFNIFIDDILRDLNDGTAELVPRCLFFADDGVILARPGEDVQPILSRLDGLLDDNHLELKVAKCACISQLREDPVLYLNGFEVVPVSRMVTYLGFPVTSAGIDFGELLKRNLQAAAGRASFLSIYSDTWGALHRLRIHKTYI